MMKIQRSAKRQTTAATGSLPCAANIAQFELANGVRIFVYENFNSPAVVINGYLLSGSLDETRENAGLAGFVSDCLMRGTKQFSYEQIFEQTEAIGAGLNVSSGMYTTSFSGKSLVEDLPFMMSLLADVLRRPTFPKADVEKERAEWLTGLQERENNTGARCGLAFRGLCYPKTHPMSWSSDGYVETAQAITIHDLHEFHQTYYAPKGMVIAVVGAVKAAQVRAQVAAMFGDWVTTRPPQIGLPVAPAIKKQARKHVKMPGKMQSNFMLGFPALPQTHPDWMACQLMDSILGQFGMYGRLGDSVRKEEGLVYYIGSRFDGGLAQGPWYIYAGTNPKTIDRVVHIALAEVQRMMEKKVTPTELRENKSFFIGSIPLQMETNEGIAGQIVSMLRYGRGLDYLLEFPDRVNAITTADVQRVAQTWLNTERYVLATAGA